MGQVGGCFIDVTSSFMQLYSAGRLAGTHWGQLRFLVSISMWSFIIKETGLGAHMVMSPENGSQETQVLTKHLLVSHFPMSHWSKEVMWPSQCEGEEINPLKGMGIRRQNPLWLPVTNLSSIFYGLLFALLLSPVRIQVHQRLEFFSLLHCHNLST